MIERIIGLMLEVWFYRELHAGRQDVVDKNDLVYGQSITERPCMDWAQTVSTLHIGPRQVDDCRRYSRHAEQSLEKRLKLDRRPMRECVV